MADDRREPVPAVDSTAPPGVRRRITYQRRGRLRGIMGDTMNRRLLLALTRRLRRTKAIREAFPAGVRMLPERAVVRYADGSPVGMLLPYDPERPMQEWTPGKGARYVETP